MKPYMNTVVANDSLRRRLCGDILSGTLSHAYIIEGGQGSGKHTIARLTAAALSCERSADEYLPLPCTECPSCRKILQGLSPDVITVTTEGKASLGVDSIRFLKEDVFVVPNDLDYKVYIIEDADKMTPQAQNAFLLTLEEPPSYVVFFLLCENSELLLETIKSRAPILRTEPISVEAIDEYISANDGRAAQMKLASPSEYSELLMASANGIGRALELLEPKRFAPVLERRALAKDFVKIAVEGASSEKTLALIPRFALKRDIVAEELTLIYAALRDIMLSKKSDLVPLCFYESRDTVFELGENISMTELLKLSESVFAASERLGRNANVRLTLTLLLSESGMI